MTIPAYLTALADLCDKHGTHAKGMGPELRLLAGLPWGEQWHFLQPPGREPNTVKTTVSPADIARGWLICARPLPTRDKYDDAAYGSFWGFHIDQLMGITDRAAACAELAVLSMRWRQTGLTKIGPHEALTMTSADPHDGTIEGGRAAWSFILSKLLERTPPRGFPGTEQQRSQDALLRALAETYRRELEAMK